MSKNTYRKHNWGVHIVGPDTIIPAVSFEQAVEKAAEINKFIAEKLVPDASQYDPVVFAQINRWEMLAGIGAPHNPDDADWDNWF